MLGPHLVDARSAIKLIGWFLCRTQKLHSEAVVPLLVFGTYFAQGSAEPWGAMGSK